MTYLFQITKRTTGLSVLIFSLLYYTMLQAQVVIKEKVSINPKLQEIGKEEVKARQTNSLASTLIMTKNGVVQMYYGQAQRLHNGIPPFAKLLIHRLRIDTLKADTVMTDSTLGRYGTPAVTFPAFTCDTAYEWTYPTPIQPFSAMIVRAGDTIQFVYITTDNVINGQIDSLQLAQVDTMTPYGWSVTIGRWDNCRGTWSDMISGFIGVADTTIAFTTPISNSVYPKYYGHNNSTNRDDTLDLRVQVQFNSTPVKNYWVELDTTVLVDSGGHSHDGNRPLGTFLVPKTLPQSGYDTMRTFTKQTDSLGNVNFKYLASQFGGTERISARRVSDTTSFDTLRITTKVDSLIDFSTTQTNQWNYTGSSGPTTYWKCPGTILKHPLNHYIVPRINQTLQEILTSFYQWSGSPKGGGQYLKLGVNDMSLSKGGLFDICNNWTTGHNSHRRGTSVDIDSSNAELISNPGHFIPLQHYQVEQLTKIAKLKDPGIVRAPEEVIHYEFPGQ